MQAKGIVRFFLILLLLVCAGQFIYMFPTNKVEKNAEIYAKEAAAKGLAYTDAKAHYLDSMSSEKILSVPLVGNFTYQECKAKQLALGLDLKGGMSVVLQVDLRDFLTSLSGNTTDPEFKKAMEAATVAQKTSPSDYIKLFVDEFKKSGKTLASVFARNEALKGNGLNIESSDAQVQAIIRTKANETVKETFNRLKKRIDKLGVVQPNVSLDAARDMILVELPGFENPQRARSFLQAAAKLEFWEVYRNSDPGVLQAIGDADNALKAGMDTTKMKNDTAKTAGTGPILSGLTLSNNPQAPPTAVIGSAEKNKMKSISAMLDSMKSRFPQDMVFRWSKDPVRDRDGKASTLYELYALKKARGKSGPALEGDHVTRATAQPDPMSGEVAVSLSMDGTGAAIWSELTGRAAADNRREVAIVLDDEVVSAPHVNDKISGGNSSITGNYTVQEAQDMASKLEVGKLPAKTEIVQEATVGPSLGAENIQKSLISLGVALLAIVGFMIYYYGSGGIVAVVALLLNLFFIVGALTSLGTVLTLPGIASIILTMGIAVDANVIVYERIREELTAGKNLWQAIKDGFIHATPAIVDGNVTNIIAAIVLGYFGLGPVKGFAITLLVGVLFTLFTSLLVSRLIIEWWTQDKNKDIKFSTPSTENLFKDINIDWMAMRYKTYMISGAFILAGVVSFFVRGFDLGVDLKGGYSYNVQFDKKVNEDVIRKTLEVAFEKQTPIVKAVSTANTYNITTAYKINEVSTEAQEQVTTKLYEGLKAAGFASTTYDEFKSTYSASKGTHITSSSKVGPMVADDIKSSSLKANFLALALIFLYILLRFRRWQYSTGAVIALFHDVLFILACFTLFHGFLPFSLEVDQAIIAAVLTISAYSMNDTVIVYDRIREYARTYNNLPMRDIINKAINSTLSRTIITSFNVLLVVLILFIFGGSSIKGFAFALIVGIFIGTYSSIFIASPVMLDLSKNLNLSENSPNPVLDDVESLNALSKQKSK
ncbi:MAG: hypothetical protein RIS64_2158 [Bacteroidota bacterium]|jgi:SecD/SecF fusion protein